MMRFRSFLLVAALWVHGAAGAQTVELERILVPVFVSLTTDPLSRITLRIYNMDRVPATFAVRMIQEGSNEILRSSDFTLIRSEETAGLGEIDVPTRPSSVEINVLDHFPTLGPHNPVRLEIIPYTEGLEYWAFVIVTDNRTQNVQIITP